MPISVQEKKERKAPKRKAASTKVNNGHAKSDNLYTRNSCTVVYFHSFCTRKPRKATWRSDDESEGEESSEFDSGEEVEAQPKGTSEQEDEGRDEKRDRGGRTTRSTAKVGYCLGNSIEVLSDDSV